MKKVKVVKKNIKSKIKSKVKKIKKIQIPGKITKIFAYEILDSRGYPTVACSITTKEGIIGKSMVPSGASTGEREALELRDKDPARFHGKGVLQAINNVNKYLAPKIIEQSFSVTQQKEVDAFMIKLDGTNNKSKYGANAILSISLAICDAAAKLVNKPLYQYIKENLNGDNSPEYILPIPMLNVINGGAHADNTIDFQEFMFMPVGAKSFKEACVITSECFHQLAKNLKKQGFNTSKGDEGGFAPLLSTAESALDNMVSAIKDLNYKPSRTGVAIALDTACSELYENNKYTFTKAVKAKNVTPGSGKNIKSTNQMVEYLESLVEKYPIISIEDGLAEQDWNGWQEFVKRSGKKIQIVGDDLYCTNPEIIKEGIKKNASNSVLIKLNQIGTLIETIEAINLAHKKGWTCVVSHRSGETENTFIADLAVGMETGQIKTGSMSRSERIAKYNRLIEIEIELGKKAKFGLDSFYKKYCK